MRLALFLAKRAGSALVTVLIVSVLVFCLLRLVPGDPAALVVGDLADEQKVAEARAQLGLDRPLPVQYLTWLGRLAQGDLGRSFMTDQPVLGELTSHFLVTLQLVIGAFVLSALIAIPLGVLAAWRKDTAFDRTVTALATLGVSAPTFWVGLLLALLFGAQLGWLPTLGFVSMADSPAEWARHIVLPTLALVWVESGILTRLVRANTLEVLSQDYVDYARSKAIGEGAVLRRHVLKNALAPTLPMLGLILSSLLSGTAVIETVFGIPGLGRFLVDAIYARDYPVIQGVLLFVVCVYAVVNIVVDLLHPLFDPRVSPA